MPQSGEVVCGRKPGRACTDDEHALPRRRGRTGELPALLDREIADEALDGVDAHRLIELGPVADRLAGVVADSAHHARKRIVVNELLPCPAIAVTARLRFVEPRLDVFTGRAGLGARREEVDVDRAFCPPRARLVREARTDVERDGEGLLIHTTSSSCFARSPNLSTLRSA